MTKLPYKVDAVDFTDLVHKYGYTVTYERVRGENDFVYLNGNEEEDVLQIKPVVAVRINDVPTGELSTFLAAVLKPTVRLTYYDPAHGEITRTALPTVEAVSLLLDDGTTRWWSGFTVTMRVNLDE